MSNTKNLIINALNAIKTADTKSELQALNSGYAHYFKEEEVAEILVHNSPRDKYLAMLEAYKEYAKLNNCHQKPKKGVNSGSDGRFFEGWCALDMDCFYRSNLCQGAYYADIRKKRADGTYCKYECKQGFGELGSVINGRLVTIADKKNDYLIYSFPVNLDAPTAGAWVVDVRAFVDTLIELDGVKYDPKRNRLKFKSDCKKTRAKIMEALEACNAEPLVDHIERKGWLY